MTGPNQFGGLTSSTELPPTIKDVLMKGLLATAYKNVTFPLFAQKRTVDYKTGYRPIYRRMKALENAVVPLADDGRDPNAVPLQYTDLKGELKEYGRLVVITRKALETNQMDVMRETANLLSHCLKNSVDVLTRDVLLSTSSVLQCSHGINGQVATELTGQDILAATQTLMNNSAEFISEIIRGTEQIGTLPLREAFWGFISVNLLDDLDKVDGFRSVANYPSFEGAAELKEEWGSTGNVRWLWTNVDMTVNGAAHGAGVTPVFYNNIIVGKEAYGDTYLGSSYGQLIVKSLGQTSSLLNRTASMGIYWVHDVMLLNDAWCINLVSTHS